MGTRKECGVHHRQRISKDFASTRDILLSPAHDDGFGWKGEEFYAVHD